MPLPRRNTRSSRTRTRPWKDGSKTCWGAWLGGEAFNGWNKALHGVARAGIATVFPQAIGLAATSTSSGIRASAGEEVVQLYVTDVEASGPTPIRSLQGFQRVSLRPGERRRVTFTLSARQLSFVDSQGTRIVEPGWFEVSVGGKQPGFTGLADGATTGVVTGRFQVVGEAARVPR